MTDFTSSSSLSFIKLSKWSWISSQSYNLLYSDFEVNTSPKESLLNDELKRFDWILEIDELER